MNAGRRSSVKVRWERGAVIGPLMLTEEARQLTETLLAAVLDCGDGKGFVTVMGFDGRTVHVRGREVITVECLPELPARIPPAAALDDQPARTYAGGGTVSAVGYPSRGIGEPAPGTRFLQQQAARAANGSSR